MSTVSLALHVFFASIVVGPQVLLFLAVIPSTWLIEDEPLRRSVTRVVTRRYGLLTGISLIGLLVTGLYQFYSDAIVPVAVQDEMMNYRWGMLFSTKMTLVLVLVALIGVHGAVFGKRIRQTSEAVERGEAEPGQLEAARRASFLFSTLLLVVSIAIMFAGVAMANHGFSLQPR